MFFFFFFFLLLVSTEEEEEEEESRNVRFKSSAPLALSGPGLQVRRGCGHLALGEGSRRSAVFPQRSTDKGCVKPAGEESRSRSARLLTPLEHDWDVRAPPATEHQQRGDEIHTTRVAL